MVGVSHSDGYLYRLCREVSCIPAHFSQPLTHNSISVKWVGLFVTALVGIYTVEDLWNKFGDLRMPFVSLDGFLEKAKR